MPERSSIFSGLWNDRANSQVEIYVLNSLAAIFDNATNDLVLPTNGLTVTAGGITVTADGITVTAGGITVTAGGIGVTAGNIDISAGTLNIQDGGTVIQGTDKTTGVTLNTHTGQITMNAASLAAAAEVVFVVTNSKVAAPDVVIINHGSVGASDDDYFVGIGAISAGSFSVVVSNLSGGSLSEAIVLNFVIIKGNSS